MGTVARTVSLLEDGSGTTMVTAVFFAQHHRVYSAWALVCCIGQALCSNDWHGVYPHCTPYKEGSDSKKV